MKNLLKCKSLIRVAIIIVVMAFMASQVTDTYAQGLGTSGGGGGSPLQGYCKDAWSKLLTTDRFELVMNGEGVLDKETCLVWEQSPATATIPSDRAFDYCSQKEIGGRLGWHLPTVEQLASLVDLTQSDPALPIGYDNFFSNVQSDWYYVVRHDSDGLYPRGEIHLSDGFMCGRTAACKKDDFLPWCVRGGPSH